MIVALKSGLLPTSQWGQYIQVAVDLKGAPPEQMSRARFAPAPLDMGQSIFILHPLLPWLKQSTDKTILRFTNKRLVLLWLICELITTCSFCH